MGVGQLSESDAVDALRLPFYSSSHPTGSHGWRNQFDLGNPDLDVAGEKPTDGLRIGYQPRYGFAPGQFRSRALPIPRFMLSYVNILCILYVRRYNDSRIQRSEDREVL